LNTDIVDVVFRVSAAGLLKPMLPVERRCMRYMWGVPALLLVLAGLFVAEVGKLCSPKLCIGRGSPVPDGERLGASQANGDASCAGLSSSR